SMSRALPTRAASEITARDAGRMRSSNVIGSETATYSRLRPAPDAVVRTRPQSFAGSRSPCVQSSRAASSPRDSATAFRRSSGEVLTGAELRRVHEDRYDGRIVLPNGAFDERGVTRMERTHGRYKTNGDIGRRRAERASVGDGTKNVQSAGVSSLCIALYAGTVEIGGRSTSMMSCISRCSFPPDAAM